jgi:hypothetical protein
MRRALTALLALTAVAAAGCGGADSAGTGAPTATSAPRPAPDVTPAPVCRHVPRTTVRMIASHGNRRTRFNARAAAAVDAGSGYAVSVPAVGGGSRRMGTWFVDRLRAPHTVTSGNVEALRVTNWPLDARAAEPARQSQLCATQNLRGPGPLAP